jgi:hypothetical protein
VNTDLHTTNILREHPAYPNRKDVSKDVHARVYRYTRVNIPILSAPQLSQRI